MSRNQFKDTVNTLFEGMERMFSTKTVVGEPKQVGDTLIVPLMDVSFWYGFRRYRKGEVGQQHGWYERKDVSLCSSGD